MYDEVNQSSDSGVSVLQKLQDISSEGVEFDIPAPQGDFWLIPLDITSVFLLTHTSCSHHKII